MGPNLLPLLGSPSSFLPIFSLSPPMFLCFSLPCSRAFHGHFTVEDKQKNTQQNKNKKGRKKKRNRGDESLNSLSQISLFLAVSTLTLIPFHFHGFNSIGSTRPHQAHNDPEGSSRSQNPRLH